VTVLERVVRAPVDALQFANVVLTTGDAVVGASPREVVWSHRGTTLYRYRSSNRRHAVPVLLVFGDAAAAAKICAALMESRRSCETTVFEG